MSAPNKAKRAYLSILGIAFPFPSYKFHSSLHSMNLQSLV